MSDWSRKERKGMKVVQITAVGDWLFALGDDGSIWRLTLEGFWLAPGAEKQ